MKDTFCALERGPVPSFLYDAVKVATNSAHAVKRFLVAAISGFIKTGKCRMLLFYRSCRRTGYG